MFHETFWSQTDSLLYAYTKDRASNFSLRRCMDDRAANFPHSCANKPEISAATQSDCRPNGCAAASDDTPFSGGQRAGEMDADRTIFRIAVDSRLGAAGISTGRKAVQSEDERTQPWTLHHIAENSVVAEWKRDRDIRAAWERKDQLGGVVSGRKKGLLCKRQ